MGEAAEEVGHDQAERQHALAEEEELEDGADDHQDDGVAIAQSVNDDERDGRRQHGGRRRDEAYHVQRATDVGVDPLVNVNPAAANWRVANSETIGPTVVDTDNDRPACHPRSQPPTPPPAIASSMHLRPFPPDGYRGVPISSLIGPESSTHRRTSPRLECKQGNSKLRGTLNTLRARFESSHPRCSRASHQCPSTIRACPPT